MQQYPEPPSKDEPISPPAQAPRSPLTISELYGLGLSFFGVALPIALAAGGYAWLWLAGCVMLVLLLATLQEGEWTRKPSPQAPSEIDRLSKDYVPLKLVIRPDPDRPSNVEPR